MFFHSKTTRVYHQWNVEIPKKSTMVCEKLILSPKPSSTIPSLELRRLPIQHALYRIPCCPTCDFPRRYASNKNTGKAGLKPEKKTPGNSRSFPTSIFPRDSDRFGTVFVGNSASCQAALRTVHLGLQAAALMEIHVAQAELVRLGGWKNGTFSQTAGDDFFPQPEAVSNMVWWKIVTI